MCKVEFSCRIQCVMEDEWLEEEQWMGATLVPALALCSMTASLRSSTVPPTYKQSIPIQLRRIANLRTLAAYLESNLQSNVP